MGKTDRTDLHPNQRGDRADLQSCYRVWCAIVMLLHHIIS